MWGPPKAVKRVSVVTASVGEPRVKIKEIFYIMCKNRIKKFLYNSIEAACAIPGILSPC